jgi:uncharacterized protein YPO0396
MNAIIIFPLMMGMLLTSYFNCKIDKLSDEFNKMKNKVDAQENIQRADYDDIDEEYKETIVELGKHLDKDSESCIYIFKKKEIDAQI